jgi:GT2 family glycosyltransferase
MIPDVSVIIVNFNSGSELERTLSSLRETLPAGRWDAVVIDNASTDGSAGAVRPQTPVRLIANASNVGFARGMNQGLAATRGRRVLLLNPDCRLMADAYALLAGELDRFDTCGVAGPRIVNPDGSPQGNARGDPDMLTGMFGRAALVRRLLPRLAVSRRNVVDADSSSPSFEVDWVSGACMLGRREALEAVGGFDERYFLYWEDADLCRRLRGLGYHIRYVPRASAMHTAGVSSRTSRTTAVTAFHESAYLYYATHVAPRSMAKRAAARLLLAGRRWWHLRMSAQ